MHMTFKLLCDATQAELERKFAEELRWHKKQHDWLNSELEATKTKRKVCVGQPFQISCMLAKMCQRLWNPAWLGFPSW